MQTLAGHKTKFSRALYAVHVKPLFEESLYDGTKRLLNRVSYFVYRLAHFESRRYSAIIFNLILTVLFGYRVVVGEFSWSMVVIEAMILAISIKILVIGEKR